MMIKKSVDQIAAEKFLLSQQKSVAKSNMGTIVASAMPQLAATIIQRWYRTWQQRLLDAVVSQW